MNKIPLKEVVINLNHPMLISVAHHKDRIFDLTLKGKNKEWKTEFAFDMLFPFSLPKVKLLEDQYIGKIPHVNFEGTICIDESDSIIINYKNPQTVIGYLIESAVELLDFGLLKINRTELIDEYEGYFQCVSGHIPGNFIGTDTAQKIYLKIWHPKNGRKSDGKPVFIHGDGFQLPDHYGNFSKTKSLQTIKSIYIPTEYSSLPPQGNKDLEVDDIYQLTSLVSKDNLKQISKIVSKLNPSKQFYILFGIPRSEGTRSLVLFQMNNQKPLPHPLKERSSNWKIKPYLINRHNKEYLLERGGADINLLNTRVAIIGCGSVGSEISTMLAKAGVGRLTLIDYDILEIDNIYRHRIGGSGLNYLPEPKTGEVGGWYKAELLSSHLEKELPHVKVKAVPKRIEEIVEGEELRDADVIIVAVGSPSINLFFYSVKIWLDYR